MGTKKIDEKIVSHVARLSRLSLSAKDIGKFSVQLSAILDYIEKLNKVETNDVQPMSHAIKDVKNVFRDDVIKKSLEAEDALKNAPKKSGDFFVVPKVIE